MFDKVQTFLHNKYSHINCSGQFPKWSNQSQGVQLKFTIWLWDDVLQCQCSWLLEKLIIDVAILLCVFQRWIKTTIISWFTGANDVDIVGIARAQFVLWFWSYWTCFSLSEITIYIVCFVIFSFLCFHLI